MNWKAGDPDPPKAHRSGRASLLTPAGRGAVAVVAAEGPAALDAVDAAFQAANGRTVRQQPLDRILFGHWGGEDGLREEVVVVRTAADEIEIHCHGGLAASERILAALAARGCEIEPWQQRLERRAATVLQGEADLALARATTWRAAAILLAQREGALARAIDAIRDDLASAALDRAQQRLDELLARAPLGLHLTDPWRVAIAGRPNVGKSSLINALVGYQRAIVFDQPGTTRDVLTAETAIDGWPVRLADAAGIRETADPLEAEGVKRAQSLLAEADLVLWILDATQHSTDDWLRAAAEEWLTVAGSPLEPSRTIVVANKIDLQAERRREGSACQFVSARSGQGLPELLAAIGEALVPSAPTDEAVPFTPRQVALLQQSAAFLAAGDVPTAAAALAAITGAP